jgi:KipI family sensor histidine kinase inhibitor
VSFILTPLGDSAFVLRVGDSLGEVLAIHQKLKAADLPGVVAIAPAFASVAVFLESPDHLADCTAAIPAVLQKRQRPAAKSRVTRSLEVPVCYDPVYGLDLDEVARQSGLSPDKVTTYHAAGRYHVRCVGFTPGFPYLSGLPEILTTARRATPRTTVPSGSVAIAGRQAGIYPLPSPGGWNIIGRTPLCLFDVTRVPAALCAPGDRLRFVSITREEFERWKA